MMAVSKDDVSDLIQVNNENLMGSFKDLLKETVGQIKHANEDSVELQMKEIKKLKFYEPHNFKRKANEAQFKLNLTLGETIDNVKSAAEKSQLEKVKSDLEEGEKLLAERHKHVSISSWPKFGWSTVEEYENMIWLIIQTMRSKFLVLSSAPACQFLLSGSRLPQQSQVRDFT